MKAQYNLIKIGLMIKIELPQFFITRRDKPKTLQQVS